MKLSPSLLLTLGKKHEPSSVVGLKFKGKDVLVRTDAAGNPVMMFIGKMGPNGRIKGERYARTLKSDANGVIIKDHWDLKGKSE